MSRVQRIQRLLRNENILKYCVWKTYEMGWTGMGPTAFDTAPEFTKPFIPYERIRKFIDDEFEAEAGLRRQAWRDSVLDVTGEDIWE